MKKNVLPPGKDFPERSVPCPCKCGRHARLTEDHHDIELLELGAQVYVPCELAASLERAERAELHRNLARGLIGPLSSNN